MPDWFIDMKNKILTWLIDLLKSWLSEDIENIKGDLSKINDILDNQVTNIDNNTSQINNTEDKSTSNKDFYITIAIGVVAVLCLGFAYYYKDEILGYFKKDDGDNNPRDLNKDLQTGSTNSTTNILPESIEVDVLTKNFIAEQSKKIYWLKLKNWFTLKPSQKYILELHETLRALIQDARIKNLDPQQIKSAQTLSRFVFDTEYELLGTHSNEYFKLESKLERIINRSMSILENKNDTVPNIITTDYSSPLSSPRSDITVKPTNSDPLPLDISKGKRKNNNTRYNPLF